VGTLATQPITIAIVTTLQPKPNYPGSVDSVNAAALQSSLNKGRLANTVVVDSAGGVVASSKATDSAPPTEPESKPEPAGLSIEDVTKIINQKLADEKQVTDAAIAQVQQDSQSKLDAALANAESDKLAMQAKIDAAETKAAEAETAKQEEITARSRLEDTFKLMGSNTAGEKDAKTMQPLTIVGVGSPAMRDYEKIVANTPKIMVRDSNNQPSLQSDMRAADQFWRKNRTQISDGVEAVMRDAGFLQGAGRSIDAATLPSDIPSIAFPHLSAFVRQSHFEDLIHWQFANTAAAPGTPPGLNVAVPRYPYAIRPLSAADRTLTPGVDIGLGAQNVTQLNTLITMREMGINGVSSLPIGIWSFTSAFSIVDLESIVERNLAADYQSYKDVCLYSLWFTATTILYNSGNSVTTDPTTIVAGSKGTYTRNFLIALRQYMKINRIPPYRDGSYGLVLNPGAYGQYVQQLVAQERFVDPEQKDIVTNMLQTSTGADFGGKVSGYKGTHDGFHMFEQNSYGVGNPGDNGTQTVTFGTGIGAQTCDSSFAFGADTIAWCTAEPVQIVKDEISNFGRRERYIWKSIESEGELDVKFNSTTGTQNRVIQIRNLRSPV